MFGFPGSFIQTIETERRKNDLLTEYLKTSGRAYLLVGQSQLFLSQWQLRRMRQRPGPDELKDGKLTFQCNDSASHPRRRS